MPFKNEQMPPRMRALRGSFTNSPVVSWQLLLNAKSFQGQESWEALDPKGESGHWWQAELWPRHEEKALTATASLPQRVELQVMFRNVLNASGWLELGKGQRKQKPEEKETFLARQRLSFFRRCQNRHCSWRVICQIRLFLNNHREDIIESFTHHSFRHGVMSLQCLGSNLKQVRLQSSLWTG